MEHVLRNMVDALGQNPGAFNQTFAQGGHELRGRVSEPPFLFHALEAAEPPLIKFLLRKS